MTEERLAVAQLLQKIIAEDKNVLVNYEELLAKLQEGGVSGGDYRAINNALQYKIGAVLNSVEPDSADAIAQGRKDLQKVLQANNMLAARIEFIVDIFTYAVGWQEAEVGLNNGTAQTVHESVSAEVKVTSERKTDSLVAPSTDIEIYAEDDKTTVDSNVWICPTCGEENDLFFCENCGCAKPEPQKNNIEIESWACLQCGRQNTGKFCIACGAPQLQQDVNTWVCTNCGRENTGKFCTGCGNQR
ncbi:MAG: hypothetical protein PHQ44_00580 [Anaerovibrio sp.]|nr:hypothetical protein [Anaerovibrio sp.]